MDGTIGNEGIPVSVSWFPVDLSHDSAIFLHNQYIKKGDLSVFYLHGKLDGWSYVCLCASETDWALPVHEAIRMHPWYAKKHANKVGMM